MLVAVTLVGVVSLADLESPKADLMVSNLEGVFAGLLNDR